mmetsp:Transcript_533/g.1152  ORF Transcript_533/g.1152 Transcript_533/m.1152 type:complete len:86 (+) Transcript_533:818-1075(+)
MSCIMSSLSSYSKFMLGAVLLEPGFDKNRIPKCEKRAGMRNKLEPVELRSDCQAILPCVSNRARLSIIFPKLLSNDFFQIICKAR